MAFEMKIYNPEDSGFVTRIEWNYEELKNQITEATKDYATAVYTDEFIKAAKADRAKLNKFVTALKGKRTEIRKKLLTPDEEFGKEVDEIVSIVQTAIGNIDSQIKDYEQRKRQEKTEKVREIYYEILKDYDHLRDVLTFESIWVPEWANATCALNKIKEWIAGTFLAVDKGIRIIDETDSPYVADMKRVFLATRDISKAMAVRNQLEEDAKAREQYNETMSKIREERNAENARYQALLNTIPPEVRQKLQPETKPKEEEKRWIAFEAMLSVHQAQILASFFKSQGIEFRPVKR